MHPAAAKAYKKKAAAKAAADVARARDDVAAIQADLQAARADLAAEQSASLAHQQDASDAASRAESATAQQVRSLSCWSSCAIEALRQADLQAARADLAPGCQWHCCCTCVAALCTCCSTDNVLTQPD